MPEANVPLLAMPSGSILQFLLMTVPLLCVYLYFLYLAHERPSIADPSNPRYADDRIRLTDILYVYLATLLPFGCLVVYMLWFVPMRRGLSARYEKDGIVVLGDVKYEESYHDQGGSRTTTATTTTTMRAAVGDSLLRLRGWVMNGFALRNNYGHVVYDLGRVANHPACDYEERRRRGGGGGQPQLAGIVTKRVRVYHRYPRERISVLVLPKYPYSGQPKADLEADWASFAKYVGLPSRVGGEGEDDDIDDDIDDDGSDGNAILRRRDRGRGVLAVAIFWVCFLVLASYYVVDRIRVVDDAYVDEDAETARLAFWIVVGGVFPAVSILGNWIRWKFYERWMLHGGTKEKRPKASKNGSSRGNGDENEDGVGSYIQMS
ncbi:hypothetical protein ACHAW5_009528 [Stephanodiscus triporus]|uniref:Uncharacterized protein n=1 Tax=Stephanodiscus triporus TaxID=2934178 RepID=A0ABD3NAS0_9STRA